MNFLPKDYAPKESEGATKYLKLKNGDNLLRILSKPLIGYVGWRDKQPYRSKTAEGLQGTFENNPKEFWAVICYSYDNQCVCIWEITQKTILKAITSLANDKALGSPLKYDLKIVRTGEDLQTEYQVSPYPHRELPEEVTKAHESTNINLEALMDGGNPFEEKTTEEDSNDMPF